MVGKFSDCSSGHRIKALQRILRSSGNGEPTALLIIPGLDGRNNKESMTLLKFIFFGSVAMDLFQNSLVDDTLEEMVLLIQEDSVSIVYSSAAKKLCDNELSSCQNLIEYVSSDEEQDEVDSQQARKVCDFKRMILESIPKGSILGMSIPPGYDSAQDIESWPLLQSFALDSVICPTGFFTSKYSIVDLSEYLNIAYRAVDEHCVKNAIDSLMKSVLKHVNQTIDLFDERNGPEGSTITAGVMAGPLEMLYEFGKLDCQHSNVTNSGTVQTDELRRPIVLFGPQTSSIGSTDCLTEDWHNETAANHVHTVLEGCDPATGIRFCRTYFLKSGQKVPSFSEALVSGMTVSEEDKELVANTAKDEEMDIADLLNLERMKRLYAKLLLSLRSAVRIAFVTHTDILEAGKYIQNYMESSMKEKSSAGHERDDNDDVIELIPSLSSTRIKRDEVLQVHIDCMNSFGQVVSIEEVDDIGGTCWTYIRVTLYGVSLGTQKDEKGAISVGDTFLFSVARKLIAEQNVQEGDILDKKKHEKKAPPSSAAVLIQTLDLPLLEDSFCLTHLIPCHRCFPGCGIEEKRIKDFLVALDNPELCRTLSLGSPIEEVSYRSSRTPSTVADVTVLTDHPLYPLLFSNIKIFSGGFAILSNDTGGNPMLFSMEHHIAEMWTIDATDCLTIAQSRGLIRNRSPWNLGTQDLPDPSVSEGFLLIFRLKSSDDHMIDTFNPSNDKVHRGDNQEKNANLSTYEECDRVKPTQTNRKNSSLGESSESDIEKSMMFNPLKFSLSPLCSPSSGCRLDDVIEPECLAIFVQNGSKLAAMTSSALLTWRHTLESLDIPQHKGEGKVQSLGGRDCSGLIPSSILKSYVSAIGTCALSSTSSQSSQFSDGDIKYSMTSMSCSENIPLSASTVLAAGTSQSGLPGTGFLAMRCAHTLSESIRLQYSSADLQSALTEYSLQAQEMKQKLLTSLSLTQRKLLIITGHSGSGVHALSVLIREQLRTHQDMTNSLLDYVEINILDTMVVGDKDENITDVRILDNLEALVMTAFSSAVKMHNKCDKSSTSHVTVVTLTTAAQVLLNQAELLNIVLECSKKHSPHMYVSIGAVVAVIAPKALLTESVTCTDWTLDSPLSPGFFGLEVARGCTKSICLADVCDMAVIVDVDERSSRSDSVYFKFRKWVESVNRDAEIIRVNPTRLRVDNDDVDAIVKYLGLKKPGVVSARESARRLRHAPLLSTATIAATRSRVTLTPHSCTTSLSGLRVLRLHARSLPQCRYSPGIWSLNSLLSVLQFLFPSASVCAPPGLLSEVWHSDSPLSSSSFTSASLPPFSSTPSSVLCFSTELNTVKRGFRRLTDLATMKVFSERRFAEEKQNLQSLLNKIAAAETHFNAMSVTQMLRVGLISVEGLVRVRSSAAQGSGSKAGNTSKHCNEFMYVYVEACKGAIIFKADQPGDRFTSDLNSGIDSLKMQGSFRKPTHALLLELFSSCGALQLKPKVDLTRDDLSTSTVKRVHSRYCEKNIMDKPLPNGWWFDGNIYLDIDGNQREYRPDLELILDQYLILKNEEILEYNTLLQSLSHTM